MGPRVVCFLCLTWATLAAAAETPSPAPRPHSMFFVAGKVLFTAEQNRLIARYDRLANQVDWGSGSINGPTTWTGNRLTPFLSRVRIPPCV